MGRVDAVAAIIAALIIGIFGYIGTNELSESHELSELEITSLTMTYNGELDVKVRNIGSAPALITKITVVVLEDADVCVEPCLEPSAKYYLPIDDLSVGESKSIHISHVVGPNEADRFLIALQTHYPLLIELKLEYNHDQTVSETFELWSGPFSDDSMEDFENPL